MTIDRAKRRERRWLILMVSLLSIYGVAVATFYAITWLRAPVPLPTNANAAYHADLGWTQMPNVSSPGFTTDAVGARPARPLFSSADKARGVLAVGDSFTAGSEVGDSESWPAQLEAMIGRPVYNPSAGGWGTDQIIMRAEGLPGWGTVVLGFLWWDIQRAEFSVYGASKPYYDLVGGALVRRNDPVPKGRTPGEYERPNQGAGAAITCRLLERMSRKVIILMVYGHEDFSPRQPQEAVDVVACARTAGHSVVDTWETFITRADRDALYNHLPDGQWGHPSIAGQRAFADLLREVLP